MNFNPTRHKNMLPALVYLAGLIVSTYYAFSTSFTTVSDTLNEYSIYLSYINKGFIETWHYYMHIGYTLQLHCLTSTVGPTLVHLFLPIDPAVLFKLYVSVLSPLLPLSVFLLCRRFLDDRLSLVTALLVVSQTSYIQSPSNFRTIIAIALFAFLLLVIFNEQRKRKYVYITLISLLIVFSHYGTAIISGVVLAAAGAYILIRKKNPILYVLSVVVLLPVCYLWNPAPFWTISNTVVAQNTIVAENNTSTAPAQGSQGSSAYDKIIQAAFGIHNPNGDTTFKFSWALFVLSWLMILLTAYGLLLYRKAYTIPTEYMVMGVVFGLLAVSMFVLPQLSKIYGIERLWLQSLVVLTPAFVLGIGDVLKRMKLSPMWMYLFVGLYFWFNYHYGLIYSIMG